MKTKVRANDSLANVATENNFLSTYSQDLDLIPEFDKLNQELRELTNAEDIIKEDPNLEARQKRVLIEDLKAEVFQRKVDFIDIVSMSDNDDIRDMLPDLEYAGNAQGSMFLNWIADSRIKRKMIAREQRLSDYSEEDRKLIEGFYND